MSTDMMTAEPVVEKSPLPILLCVSIPSFMINLDANILSIAVPSIKSSLGADFSQMEWIVSSYTVMFAALLLPSGSLADKYGRKRCLLVGLFIFTIASFFCGISWNVEMLVSSRAIQGIGAALQLSSASALLSHEFRGPSRAKAFAFWGSVIGLAIVLGPVFGGLVTFVLGWEWTFFINLPVGVVVFCLASFFLEESRAALAIRVDVLGALTFGGALALITTALISGNRLGWFNSSIAIELGTAAALLTAFVFVERRSAYAMIDLSLSSNKAYLGAMTASITFAMTVLSLLTYIPLYFRNAFGSSPLEMGLLMLPLAIPFVLVPRLVAKHFSSTPQSRAILVCGLVLVGVGAAWMSCFTSSFSYIELLPGLIVSGAGAGALTGETAKAMMSAVSPDRAGMAGGMAATSRFAGIVAGVACLGAILFAGVFYSLPLMNSSESLRTILTEAVIAGDFSASGDQMSIVLRASFAVGYSYLFLAAAVVALAGAAATFVLMSSASPKQSISRE